MQSSLIQLILHELPLSQGKISVHGEISYASQEPWLFGGSIKQNIVFISQIDEKRYKQVIYLEFVAVVLFSNITFIYFDFCC